MKRKLIVWILSLAMIMSLLPSGVVLVHAEDATDIVWIGGSYAYGTQYNQGTADLPSGVTAMPFAKQVTDWYADYYDEDVNYHNVCIGGTTSMYGRSRFEKDVLSKEPDIIFIEFTGNDDYLDDHEERVVASLEGMVRAVQVYEKQAGKDVKIVFTYRPWFATEEGAAYDLNRKTIEAYHTVADYYGVYELDAAEEAKRLWEADGIEYSQMIATDGYHPNALGQYYTGLAMINILKQKPITNHITRSLPMSLGYKEIIPTYVNATDSQYLDTAKTSGFTASGTTMVSNKAGDELVYNFKGTSIGVLSDTISSLTSMYIDGVRFTGWLSGNMSTQSCTQALEPGDHVLRIVNEGGTKLTVTQLIVDGIANEGISAKESFTQNVYENDCTTIDSDEVLVWTSNLVRIINPASMSNYSNLYFDNAVGVYAHSLDKSVATFNLDKTEGYSENSVISNANVRYFEYGTAGSPEASKNIVIKATDANGNVLKVFDEEDCNYLTVTSYAASWRMYDLMVYNIPTNAKKLEFFAYNSDNSVITNIKVGTSEIAVDDVTISAPAMMPVDTTDSIEVIQHANSGFQTKLENATVTYTSSKENVATVDNNGLITAKGEGITTISANITLGGKTYTDSRVLSVNDAPMYDDYIPGEKPANLIPDASANYGVTYFAMVDGAVKGTYYPEDNAHTNIYEYTGNGTISTGWQGIDGLHLNRANNGVGSFGFEAEGGKTYVFSANVKDEAAEGIETRISLAMNDTYNPAKLTYIAPYGAEGMTVGDDWSKFEGTITLPSTYNNSGTEYANYIFFGFPADSTTGAKFRLDLTEKDSVYFAAEQAYDIEVSADEEEIFVGDSFNATATVYNQLMMEVAGEYPVEWLVVDAGRTTPVDGFTITKTETGVTVVPGANVKQGDYVLLAHVDANGGMYKGVEFKVLSADSFEDSELPELAANLIPDASANYGVTYFAMVDGAVKGTYYPEDNAHTNIYEFTGTSGNIGTDAWKGLAALHLNRANNGVGSFGFKAEAGKTYVFSANVKDEAAEGIETRISLAMNDTYNHAKLTYIAPYGENGMVVGDDWTKFEGTITLPSTYPEGGTGFENYLFFGFPKDSTSGAKFRLDLTEKDSVYFAEEQAYRINVSANTQKLYKGEELKVTAEVLNQIGTKGKLNQEFEWIILNGDKTAIFDNFTVTTDGNTATITPSESVAAGKYVAFAKSETGLQKGISFTVASGEKYQDYVAGEKAANLIPDASDNHGVTYFAMVDASALDGSVTRQSFYSNQTEFDGYNSYEYTGNGTVVAVNAWKGVAGLHLNRENAGIGSFGFVAEGGKTYVFSANVKDEAAEGIETRISLAMNDTYNPAKLTYIAPYGENGMVVGDDWTKFEGTITLPSTYPEVKTSYENYLFFGFPVGSESGAKFRLDASTKDAVYFAEEQVYDLEVTADANIVEMKDTITVTAAVLNQIGQKAASIIPEFEWVIMDENRTRVLDLPIEVSDDTSEVSFTPTGIEEGVYTLVAYTDENGGMYKGVSFTVEDSDKYLDYIPNAKSANLIPDASDGWGVTYFAMVDGALKGTYYLHDESVGGYTNTYEYTGNGTVSTGWQGIDGLHLNRANNGIGSFGFKAEAGKSYVFSANVKDEAAEGIETKVSLAMNDTYNSGKINYIAPYGAEGMVVGDEWTKFEGTITLPSTYNNSGIEYANYIFFGFPQGSTTGAKFRLDVSEKDSVYFAEEQLYDIEVESDKGTLLIGQEDVTLTAKVVNQIGSTSSFAQNFEWVALDSARKEIVEELTITPVNGTNTVTVSWDENLPRGQYVIVATSTDYEDFVQGITLNIIDSMENIYVSTTGNDSDAGTEYAPLRTLKGARDTVKAMRENGITGAIDVIFEEGTYYIDNTVTFDSDDSQTAAGKVTYKAAPGAKVVFKGSVSLDTVGAQVVDSTDANYSRLADSAKNKIVKIDLSGSGLGLSDDQMTATIQKLFGSYDYPGLYFNGNEQILAQWPNGNAEYVNFDFVSGSTNKISYAESNPDTWAVDTNSWIGGYFMNDYRFIRLPITGIDASANTISVSTISELYVGKDTDNASSQRWKAFNILEELDTPSEWYIDESTNTLYYYPEEALGDGELELSVLEGAMINITEADNIGFEGIVFANTRGDAITAQNIENVTVKGCTFENIGTNAIEITGTRKALTEAEYWQNQYVDAAYNCEISDSVFYNIGGSAVILDGGNVDTLTPGNNVFKNNIVNMAAQKIKNYEAILIKGCGNQVLNNNISRAAFQAIRHYGNNHVISYNEIYNVIQETDDSGIIYCGRNTVQRGTVISYNYLHDSYSTDELPFGHQVAIYWDDGQTGMTATNNIIKDVNIDVYTNGVDNNFSNNTSINIQDKILYYKNGSVAEAYTIADEDLYFKTYKNLESIVNANWLTSLSLAKYNTIKNNLSVNGPSGNSIGTNTKTYGTISGNTSSPDTSVFVDAANQDYRLKDSSAAQLNSSFDINLIGVQTANALKAETINLVGPYNNENIDDEVIHFMWSDVLGATKYTVTVASDAEFANVVARGTSYYNFIDLTAPVTDGTYYWKVTAQNTSREFANSWGSEVYTFTIGEVIVPEDLVIDVAIENNAVAGKITNNGYDENPVVDIYVAEYAAGGKLIGVTLIPDAELVKGQDYTVEAFNLIDPDAVNVNLLLWYANSIKPFEDETVLR